MSFVLVELPSPSQSDDTPIISSIDIKDQMAYSTSKKTVRVAVTQAEPEWLDLQASVKKTCNLIEEAASNGAQLVSFPECWIPGYPAWIWLVYRRYRYIEQH